MNKFEFDVMRTCKQNRNMEAAVNSIADTLPSEILEGIFSYCTHRDLVMSIQYVCSRWRDVVQTTRLWKNVAYRIEEDARPEQVVDMLKISPKLQNVILKHKCDDRVLEAIIDNCAELRKLETHRLQNLDLNFIKNLQEYCPKVEHLRIPDTVLADLEKCEVVGKFTNLKSLHLTEVRSLLQFEINDLRHILCMRKETLHSLGVRCCNEAGECVLPAVSTCELKSVSLSSYGQCQRHHEKAQQFARLKTLRTLQFRGLLSTFRDDIKQIFENENMAQLLELGFYYAPHFDDDVLEVIVKNCPLLKHLALKWCPKMSDASLNIIPNFKELNSLSISNSNCVTDTGILHLQDAKGLIWLRIGKCHKLTKVGLENIAKLSTLRNLCLESQNLAEFPWDLIPRYMKYLRCLGIYHCSNVDLCAIDKLKTELACLKVEVT